MNYTGYVLESFLISVSPCILTSIIQNTVSNSILNLGRFFENRYLKIEIPIKQTYDCK